MEILEIVILIAAICNFFLGFFVLIKNPSKKLNRLFAISCFLAFLWVLVNFIMGIHQTVFWLKSAYALGVLVSVSAAFWVLELCEKKITKTKIILISGLGIFFFVISYLNEFIVANIRRVYLGGFEGEKGLFFIPYWIYILGLLIFIIYTLIYKYRETAGIKKLQVGYVIIGAILYIGTVLMVSFILPLVGIKRFIPLDSPSSLFLLFFTAISILKYHLFEIRAVLTQLLVAAIVLILLVQMFTAPSLDWKILNGIILVLFCVFGYYLVKATHEESRRREEAEKLAKEAQNLAVAKDQFLLSIQHHLRTPLTPIIGYLEGILNGTYGKVESPSVRKKLISIQKSADILHNLMERLLDIQSLKVGKRILDLEYCRYEELVEEVIQEIKPEAENRKLQIKFIRVSLPQMKLDKKRIKEVIWNLLDNAVKYTEKGRIEINLSQIAREGKNFSLLSVSDTGIGITREEQGNFLEGKIFERGQMAKKLYGPGRGIGLAVSLEFIRAHNGRLWIESQGRDKGSTFYVELPILI